MNEVKVLVIMGSASDNDTMCECTKKLESFGIGYERHVASAHRTPDYATTLAKEAAGRGVKVIIAAAGGAAHLAGVLASMTHLPIIGVPMKGWALDGLDSLLSTVQMPRGIPVLTVAVGKAGAVNAAIAALQILALSDKSFEEKLLKFRKDQTEDVLKETDRLNKA